MKAALVAVALWGAVAVALAQSAHDFAQQVVRGVSDLSMSRVKQLPTGEWLRERLQVDALVQTVEAPDASAGAAVGVVTARLTVLRSPHGSESLARSAASLPMKPALRRYEVELRFAPDAAYGQWVFTGGRYWILDDQGARRVELAMFPDLLIDAPLDAPHELAWAIMSP